ncbi:MAG: hypothetical protein HYT94_02940 [Parcubacteria group bacterium]|nr:hypothetical protein [Parcubacteria group bacterium]
MTKAQEIRNQIASLTRQLESAKQSLCAVERQCNQGKHDFGDPVYTPKHEPGYMIEGDPPGVGGVDHRDSFYVSAKDTPAWTRVCKLCGKTETTTQTTETKVHTPRF